MSEQERSSASAMRASWEDAYRSPVASRLRFTRPVAFAIAALLAVVACGDRPGGGSESLGEGLTAEYSLFSATSEPGVASDTDTSEVEVGVRFEADRAGVISGLRFYKGAGNTGPHEGHLWDASGNLLTTQTFASESSSGWQSTRFAAPVAIAAGQTYVASYHTNTGHYAGDNGYFAGRGVDSGPLHAPADTAQAPNGVYRYGAAAFPSSSYESSNYWVDVIFSVATAPSPDGGATVDGASPPPPVGMDGAGSTAPVPIGNVTHGEQLTFAHVGPWSLQGVPKGAEKLVTLNPAGTRLSLHPNWGRPSYIPSTDYVYDNNPANLGGIVPASVPNPANAAQKGLMIDGYFVPAGTWVVQFRDFTDGVVIEGNYGGAGGSWPGVLFRGCRMRGNWGAPGWMNMNAVSNGGIVWVTYSDAGGTAYVPPNVCESIFESKGLGNDKFYAIRNYLSIASTLVFLRNTGDMAIENVGREVIPYYGDDTYHLNGIANGGGEGATMWLRNNLDFDPKPGASPYYKPQNDVIQMAADGGPYLGTGQNYDGTPGYQIRDNYLAGAANVLQLGVDKSNTASDVRNVVVTGNKFSTKWFQNSGDTGISYKNPTWNSYGNAWNSNTWADDYGTGTKLIARQYPTGTGPRAHQPVAAP